LRCFIAPSRFGEDGTVRGALEYQVPYGLRRDGVNMAIGDDKRVLLAEACR
jgi:hypothetical protein